MTDTATEELRFVARVHRLRTLGLGTGACAVAGAFAVVDAAPATWVAMLAHGLVWPHVATVWARRSARPQATEMRNLMLDSALGGVWVALMHFMLLPSALLVTMLSMDKLAVGGWRFLARTAAAQLTCMALTCVLAGGGASFATPDAVIVACLPLLVSYPLAVSGATFALVRTVRRQNRQLAELGHRDALSGAAGRIVIDDVLEATLARHAQSGEPATLLLVDIDGQAAINARYGRDSGDRVIRGVADLLRSEMRSGDLLGRYGGDEFALLLPRRSLAEALAVGERLRQRAIECSFDARITASCTLSIGAAELGPALHEARAWLTQADAALHQAKTQGRNRVASPPGQDATVRSR